ncbi:SAM-dependent DNA methyltransferase [Faecalicatena fissicatena]|jgi:type I restriction-modification system methyltransferase subunit|uniref:class I SAM-dependent DNA methyltransferase n=1 Tax=Faecalicatena fissicatena TaxID=290055 RepID=UPI00156DAA68|nr:class I SAM-dependent DNA methyltransferase [Faecalicatena fissicatena]NSD77544.1 SAM-dependent DNA methyltransferase [Faecalicatena fissicatena]
MVTGELKNKVDGLWEIFWTGGLTNPLDVIEQMTYLMFIRDLDDSDNVHMKESIMLGLPYKSIFEENVTIGDRKVPGNQLKWSVFHDFPAQKMYANMQENVFPFIKNLHGDKESAYAKYMGDAIFKVPTPVMLDKIVTAMDEIYEKMEQLRSEDVRGDIYEYLLSKLATAGVNGQFRTPRHIIKMMVEMMDPKADDLICDPACGTSGFLVESSEYLRKKKKAEVLFNAKNKEHYMNHMFHGYDMDRTMLRIGAMNMMTHGVSNPNIEYRDSLSDQNEDKEKYSLILANPPFKGSLDYDIVSADLLKVCKTKKTELLFLTLFVRMLKTGGKCACIVPDGVLFGSSKAHKDIRKAIVEEQRLEAVISMPSGVFKPYAGVSTAILIFTKTGHGGTDKVWFYDMKADGRSLDDKRSEVKENDIPDIIARFKNLEAENDRKRTDQSFFVEKQEIVDNAYDLSINKYKEIEYIPVEYPSTSEIMANLRALEKEVQESMAELEKMLGDEMA